MKLSPKKNGKGYTTSYIIHVGSAEARQAGFVTEGNELLELEKTIDESNQTITISIKPQESNLTTS